MSQQKKTVKIDFVTSEDLCTDPSHGGYIGFHKKNCPYCTPFSEEDYDDNDSSFTSSSFDNKTFGQDKLNNE